MAEAYRVEWTASAKRDLARVPEKVAAAVIELVYGPLVDNPRRAGKQLRFDLADYHSARRGDFRVIYLIDHHHHRIVISTVNHRGEAYRSR